MIPGLQEAIAREREIRESAFLDAPEFLCGLEAMPLSEWHYRRLVVAGSPFICGGPVSRVDIALLLWIVSPRYKAAMRLADCLQPVSQSLARCVIRIARWRTARRIARAIRRIGLDELERAITGYISDAMMDAPKGSGASGPSYWSSAAGSFAWIASQIPFSEHELTHMPHKRLWQYFKIATKLHNPRQPLFNPSDAVIRRFMNDYNARLRSTTPEATN